MSDDAMLEYIKSIDISLRELNQSYKSLDEKVNHHVDNDNTRIGALEKAAAVSSGIRGDRRRMADKADSIMTFCLSLVVSSVVSIAAAYIARR